ncbi:unnamed protein product [Withania somnifera]
MAASNTQQNLDVTFQQNYDKQSELKAFDDTKAGVKGLIDAGITKVPQIFIHPEALEQNPSSPKKPHPIFPLIDLQNININKKEIVKQIQEASEAWGFFQVIDHGIPVSVLDEMLRGARHFHEQHIDVKKPYYSRDVARKVMYNCNFDLFSEKSLAPNWRDSLYSVMAPDPANPDELPEICSRHADNDFFTVLLKDDLGGLQVFHKNQWVDVPPTHGALVINIGNILQLISNDKYKSIEHRVLANKIGPRISVASFFSTGPFATSRIYGPIEELLSKDDPPKYRSITMKEFFEYSTKKGLDGNSNLSHYKII